MIVDFMKEEMKRHSMLTAQGKHDFWDEVMDKYNITKARLPICLRSMSRTNHL